jgi:DNA-binding transcriptional MerR regulator
MGRDELLGIGAFAVLSGLSVNALRHYDEIGLLKPAHVDKDTGYRRYRPAQVRQARIIWALRHVDLPVESVREAISAPQDGPAFRAILLRHREALTARASALALMITTVDQYIEQGVAMPDLKTPRIVGLTINVTDLSQAIAFYEAAFDATWNEDISSFVFGTWPSDEFFLLSVTHDLDTIGHGEHHGPTGTTRFGLLVADVDAAHRKALDAGATERFAPYDKPWKPRTSHVTDPSGNWIDLTQA